jgi:hypothetical protein
MPKFGPVPIRAVLSVESGSEYLVCPFCKPSDVPPTCTHIDEVTGGYYEGKDYDCGDQRAAARTFRAVNGTISDEIYTDLRYSSRRHWVEIHIDCEFCYGGSLVLAQCKGSTQVFLVPNPEPVSARESPPHYAGQPRSLGRSVNSGVSDAGNGRVEGG